MTESLWCWQEKLDSGWGLIAAVVPTMGMMLPLVSRTREVALSFQEVAVGHCLRSGNEMRFARYDLVKIET